MTSQSPSSRRAALPAGTRSVGSRTDRRKRFLAWFLVVLMMGSVLVSFAYYLQQPAA